LTEAEAEFEKDERRQKNIWESMDIIMDEIY
jgi:hypothetical protein